MYTSVRTPTVYQAYGTGGYGGSSRAEGVVSVTLGVVCVTSFSGVVNPLSW
jgi:hypothetical protein